MSSHFETFKKLHQSGQLFLLPNVWNAKSAMVFEEKKFPAIATSSAAVAESLGYKDGEQMSFDEYFFIIKRILSCTNLPLSTDIETGYGNSDESIYKNVRLLAEAGVAGINIEDSVINPAGRTLKEANLFAKTIDYLKNKLEAAHLNLFINIRCDTYILNVKDKQKETVKRLKIYNSTGADGIFLPCIQAEEDIAEAINNTKLPLNVMCIPGLPCFDTLNQLGVRRVSMGPFLFNKIYNEAGDFAGKIITDNDFSSILS